ncbi:MAG: two-component hybrid sensor and regulator histidine kinase [Candidatus Magnetoglobus multicellularis str. Araruama]|uniref:Sensory/regulatory protein RpfC n=1 Tax=Candidatus Magnetoglobus multicellularis str. Araruama TaxID=890399 RepID=A0A1V1P0W0_9BACT|nr:MAG: two-component hybrid sensor and regulator histidine kinase [Candidatus Magnetoglobus multicellularis str. Araruama]
MDSIKDSYNKDKLLLVDDTEENLDLLIEFLSDDYELSIAVDGFNALERVELDLPDLVLLDVMMPGIDGYKVCQKIKSNPVTKDIPIIFLTSRTDTDSIVKGFEMGAADYVTKPFNEKELLARVKVHLDLKHALEEAEQAKEKAEQSEKFKSTFLTTMSHEIRTPINGVLGMASLLMDTKLDPLQQEYIDILKSSGEMLLVLINDILDFSKIESGKMILEKHNFQLSSCIKDVYNLLSFSAAKKGIELIENIDQNVPKTIIGDKTRLRQILFNLIGNAIKFTEKGEVFLNIKTILQDNHHYTLEFSVKDTGIGIPLEKTNQLFKSFSQVDTSTTRKYGGTGLGLAICDRLVNLMGGKIWVESEEGKGATFFFTIDTTASETQADPIQTAELEGKRILIVDNNQTLTNVIASKCKSWGMLPCKAQSGNAALDEFNKTLYDKATHFDMVVLDMDMPDISGLDLVQMIQNHPETYGFHLVFLNPASQSNQISHQKEKTHFISKPFREDAFYEQLIQCFSNIPPKQQDHPKEEEIKANPQAKQKPQLKILVVEDVSTNQIVILRFLKKMGYVADLANNGIEALKALDKQSYDMIFMDIMMPIMDGVTATQEIRKKYASENHPWIVALTADAFEGKKEEYLSKGMNDYLSKPINFADLKNAIDRFIDLGMCTDS